MNVKGIIKIIVLLMLLMLFFHPILSIMLLIKFGGVMFAIIIVTLAIKLVLGKSILDFFRTEDR